jgi:hypothetical protein
LKLPRATLVLAVAGQLLILLGILDALRPWVLVPLAVIAVVAWRGTADSRQRTAGVARSAVRCPLSAVWLLVIAALPLAALALYPPVAFDETLYHLPMVRAIATSGAIRFLPDVRFPVFPQLHEVLCAPVFQLFGDTATHFVAVIEVLLLAALLFEWKGLLAAALVLGNPIVMQVGSVTYVEAALMLFVAAGFYCLDHEHYAAAGFLLGTACSVKYLGLYFAVAGLVYACGTGTLARPGTGRSACATRYLLGLAAGTLPMYGWITFMTGNPVFPFFGSSPWHVPVSHSPANLWRLFWDITFARERVNWQPPYSPLFAISIVITLIAATRNRKAAFIGALCIGYLAIFAFLPQDSRYLLPLLPLVSVVAASVVGDRKVLAISLIVVLPGFAYAAYRVAKQGIVPRQTYIEQHLPEIRALEHRGAGRTWVCGAEQLKYYGGETLVGDVVGPYRTMPPDARYVLIAKEKCAPPPGFHRIYADAAAELWAR